MSSFSSTYPSQRPVFALDAANAGRLDPRCSFTRSDTPPTYAAPSAVHFWSNEKHLSSENLLKYSTGFDAGTWVGNGLSDRDPAQTDPSGATNGVTLVEDSLNSYHRVYQGISVASASPIAFTIFAKRNSGSRYLMLTLSNGVNNSQVAVFDLAGGAPTTGAGTGSTYTSVSATQTASGNGYYKCVLKATGGLVSAHVSLVDSGTPAPDLYGLKLYTGDGSSSIDVAFASLSTTGATDYNATTTSIHRQYSPSLKSVATAGQPRFEYSTDGQSMGILIEGSATNLINYSESFSNHSVSNSTLTENAAVGPTGTLNANLLVPTSSGTSTRNINLNDGNPISHTSGNNYAFSIYAKAAGYNYLQWVGGAYFGYTYCNFDLTNGTVGSKSSTVTGQAESVGNGWYRLTVIAAATQTNSSTSKGIWGVITSSTEARNATMTGDAYSGVMMTMAQCELGSFSSSYITSDSGSAAGTTRASESLSVDTADIGYTGGPVTIVSETEGGQGNYPMAFSLSDETSSNRVYVYRGSSTADESTDWFLETSVGGASVASTSITSSAAAGKLAVSYDTDSIHVCASGGSVIADNTAPLLPAITELQVGAQFNGSFPLNGHCKRIAVWGEALSDSNLQAITS